jgi:hypothetical protein
VKSAGASFCLPDIFENIFPPRNTEVVVSAPISEGAITDGHLEGRFLAIISFSVFIAILSES